MYVQCVSIGMARRNDTNHGVPCVKSPDNLITLDLGSEAKGKPCTWPRWWNARVEILVSGQNGRLREKGIERDSRTGHELSVLANAPSQGGVYDQLNVGGLGCLEVICRRIAVLVEAHSQPNRPKWTAARYLEGAPTSEEVILPGLRSYAMRRVKDRGIHSKRSPEVVHPIFGV